MTASDTENTLLFVVAIRGGHDPAGFQKKSGFKIESGAKNSTAVNFIVNVYECENAAKNF